MTEPASDELIAMAESMAELAKTGGASGYAVAGMFERLIARIRQQDETIKRMDEALDRIASANARSTNSKNAPEAFAWCRSVAKSARAARKEQP